MKYLFGFLITVVGLFSCGTEKTVEEKTPVQKPVSEMNDEELTAYADSLAHKFIIADSHVDLPYRLTTKFFQIV
ncbi:MAG: hypothetical protein R2769_02920 [Saprospiraceae bacterium]